MQMRNQSKLNNNKIKKSHTLLIGSFLIVGGFVFLTWNYFLTMREQVYSDMRIAMMDEVVPLSEVTSRSDEITEISESPEQVQQSEQAVNYVVDYSKYLGVLEIPKIGLKRGFYNIGSKYNDIKYNVTMVEGSTLPDVPNGNLILMAHSGDAYISYFAYLYRLNVGDMVYVTYAGVKYNFQIVNIYEVEKNGAVVIKRDRNKTSLTMITCTKNNDATQTVYISELIS